MPSADRIDAAAIRGFIDEIVVPGEAICRRQIAEAGDPHAFPPHLDEMKDRAREQGLWNLFLTNSDLGPGLTNERYAPLAEQMGRSPSAPEVFNCSAPDTGNMEILALRGTADQRERWLEPLLAGMTRSVFSMTEPGVASSDPTNLRTTIRRDGEHYVVSGRKWFSCGALNPRCAMLIALGLSDPTAPRHRRHSMIIVPRDADGLEVVRSTPIYGYDPRGGQCEVVYHDVRVPAANLIGAEGEGFAIAQARLGPGRIHHAMRLVGMAELALELLIERARTRNTFGVQVIDRDQIREAIALSRIEIDQARLGVLAAARAIDEVGAKQARGPIAMIKVNAPRVAATVIDRAIQVHGAAGFTDDFPLAEMWVSARTIQMGDGPDEVHLQSLAKLELG